MSTVENKALVPVPEAEREKIVVDSDNFLDFLHSSLPTDRKVLWEFFPYLDLEIFTPQMQLLQDEAQTVYVFSEDKRKKFERDITKRQSTVNPKVYDLIEDMDKTNLEIMNQQAEGERSMTIFYDPMDGLYKDSPIQHGKYAAVKVDTIELIKDEKIPILQLHTHPADSLFSPIDYNPLLTSIYKNDERIVNATLVVCPSVQVLALPTPLSPCLSFEELISKNEEWERKKEDVVKSISRFDKRVLGVQRAAVKFYNELHQDVLGKALTLIDEQKEGVISEGEFLSANEDLRSGYKAEGKRINDRSVALVKKIALKRDSAVEHESNTLLIQYAREMNIQLYFSTNMKDFTAFTA